MTQPNIESKYMFDMQASINYLPLGEVPDGFRVELQYQTESTVIFTDDTLRMDAWQSDPEAWEGLEGRLLSGSDRMTVTKDGAMRLNGRATIAVVEKKTRKAPDRPFLIGIVYAGVVDLVELCRVQAEGVQDKGLLAFAKWRTGEVPSEIPVTMTATFELAKAAEVWGDSRYRAKNVEDYKKYERLARGQYFAQGKVRLRSEPYSPVNSVRVRLHEIQPDHSLELADYVEPKAKSRSGKPANHEPLQGPYAEE